MRARLLTSVLIVVGVVAGCTSPVDSTGSVSGSASAAASSPSDETPSPQAIPGDHFVGGRLQSEMTGATERTWDLELATDVSFIADETINLVFGSSNEAGLGQTVVIFLEGDEFSLATDGGSADVVGRTGEGCTHEVEETGSLLSGTFECTALTAIASNEVVIGPVDVSGSFQAALPEG